jgi:putative glutamine amidotransferase
MTRARRPHIGVSSNLLHADPERPLYRGKVLHYVEEKLVHAVQRAGAIPVPVAALDSSGLEDLLSLVDGIVLSGGADVSPTSYGESPLDPRWAGDAVRDDFEIRLLRGAMARGLPVLGVCRGVQLLNAGLGGTLYQDLNTQLPESLVHRDWHRYDELEHEVRLSAGSWAARCHGATELLVNSVHHQGIKDLAPGLEATAWAPDGVIEAVQGRDPRQFVVGVQWHPEWLDGSSGSPRRIHGAPLFAAFAEACRERGTES